MKQSLDFRYPLLKLEHISLRRGQNLLLSDVTKEISLEGFSLLKGRNGVGKTSFLYMILGITPPQQGRINLWGEEVKTYLPFIGFMSQQADERALMLPVREHILIAIDGKRWGMSLSLRRYERVMALLEDVGAVHLAKRPWGGLSGGEKQRVLLAQAIAKKPKLLILDEPLAALDSIARQDIMEILCVLQKRHHLSILMTAHEAFDFKSYFPLMREITIEEQKLHV